MIESNSYSRKLFVWVNYICMICVGIMCILPFVQTWAVSLSDSAAVDANAVKLWPVGFNTDAYTFILKDSAFVTAFAVSIKRLLLGTAISMVLTILTAYPLSKEPEHFRLRLMYVWYLVITMLIGGGLVPTYMAIRTYGLLDSMWALVLPGAVAVFHIVLLLNFFRGLPKALEEAAFIDGAGHITILARIYLPLSLPALATITLFTMVGHWNSWFDGLLYMDRTEHYPLQTYLQTIVVKPDLSQLTNLTTIADVTERSVKTAQIFLGMLPILVVYPFLQRYFIKGIVLGSVKG
ncbi:carbohydrate ABC transporter permease [Paenibacillus eucommiae]|uniref:Aldouronate transport system permease protein n=1 Tax=Paenibacillus eucommiae TaxID=1355755 RepID=A0ABS4J1N4_9BACL|nr:carbohydrate ABC transporter permease [Paenibacillus eucommiae]MBP1993742.1 putative aldouronate transport system permease protein [Paenibacillus eucommiae]